ncbi:MAG: hypothetical protein IKB23_03715 [Clostridia bacterium]|nr:hypothetical protein [Clostridia bacterium]
MEQIGIVKEIDRLGRICIPKDIRNLFLLNKEVQLIITPDGLLIRNTEYVLVKKDLLKLKK